jgi:hypothetical protein
VVSCAEAWLKRKRTSIVCSVWKSGHKTGKKPWPDRTLTSQDRKLLGPIRTVTAVRSMVHHTSEILKTEQRPVWTSLNWSFDTKR